MPGRFSAGALATLTLLLGGCSLRGLDGLARDHDVPPSAPARPSDASASDGPRAQPADAPVGEAAPEAGRVEPPRTDPAPSADAAAGPAPDLGLPVDAEPEAAAPVEPRPDARPDARDGRPEPAGTVVMVVDGLPLDPDDQAIAARFAQRGLGVQICNDDDAPRCDTNRATLIFLSATAESAKVGTTFRGVAKPVVVSDNLMFDEMAFVEDDSAVDPNQHGSEDGNVIVVEATPDARALTAGLTGMVTITTGPVHLNWGTPQTAALRAAHVVGRAERVLLFGFPAGSALVGNVTAAGRRVGLFLGEGAAVSLTADGWKLFDAAITWALE